MDNKNTEEFSVSNEKLKEIVKDKSRFNKELARHAIVALCGVAMSALGFSKVAMSPLYIFGGLGALGITGEAISKIVQLISMRKKYKNEQDINVENKENVRGSR